MKKTFLLSILTISGLSNISFANSVQEDKNDVLRTIENYTSSIACEVDINPHNIFPMYTSSDMRTYYVLWTGDKGCNGGSGTIDNYVSVVEKIGNHRPFMVSSDEAFGRFDIGDSVLLNTRFIESIKQINSETFEVVSANYADDFYGGSDAGNNFPGNLFRYRLELINDNWVITDQKLLKQIK